MASLTGLLAVSEPSGLWAIIIKSFESGVGSYILAVLLLTIIIRVVWAPVDLINKKFNKKMTRDQAKLQPQMEKLEKQYAKDPQMLNRKKQELYKKANAGLGGGCLFMVLFLALNLTIFGTMFTTMNAFSSYKVNQQYEQLKYGYVNVLSALDNERTTNLTNFENILDNYENIVVSIEEDKVVLKNGETTVLESSYRKDFTSVKDEEKKTYTETEMETLIATYITDNTEDQIVFVGDTITANDVKYSLAMQEIAMKYVKEIYKDVQSENSFLWIGNIWVADSPFNQSVQDYNGYKGIVGVKNVATNEEVIYNSFMKDIQKTYNRVNGYFILAILSVLATFLSIWISNGISRKKNSQPQIQPKQGKLMYIIMPLIMAIFAIMYNSVFAFYLVVGQIISTLLTPLQNLILDKWEARDLKKEEEKTVVEYSRKNEQK